MHRDDLYSPNAAESYFNSSPFGQLYALLALTRSIASVAGPAIASTDVFELERRIEALERGAFPRYY